MKITAQNDSYKAVVTITLTNHEKSLTDEELAHVVVTLGDAILHAMEKLPFRHNSVCGGQIKVEN